MPKKGENIYKRKDGRWEGRYIKYNQPFSKSKYGYVYAKSYKEVKEKLNVMKAIHINKGETSKSGTITYDQVLSDWLKTEKIHVKESTYSRYRHLIEHHIRNRLGGYPINKLTTKLLGDYIENLLTSGRLDGKGGLDNKTVADILVIIKSSIKFGCDNGIPSFCNLDKLSVKKKEKKIRVLSLSEQEKLLNILLTDPDLYKLGVLISLYTGIRLGELCALRWENVCLSTRTLRIQYTMQRIQNYDDNNVNKTKIIITEPKSASSIRDIPIPECLMEFLKKYSNHPKAFVLTGDHFSFIEPRTMQNRFKKYLRMSGIDDVNYHVLRHTFATRCVEAGFEIKSLSEILGHSNVNITLNRYVHSSFELKSENMNKLTFPEKAVKNSVNKSLQGLVD